MPGAVYRAMLDRIQNELFDLGADLATPGSGEGDLRITADQVARLEPLRSFILPGGGGGAAYLHLARSIARRAERSAVTANAETALNPQLLAYLNRLSDHLFVLARTVARTEGGDILWKPGATRDG
jgi:cob(I)alamin adenosyltransferase